MNTQLAIWCIPNARDYSSANAPSQHRDTSPYRPAPISDGRAEQSLHPTAGESPWRAEVHGEQPRTGVHEGWMLLAQHGNYHVASLHYSLAQQNNKNLSTRSFCRHGRKKKDEVNGRGDNREVEEKSRMGGEEAALWGLFPQTHHLL